MIRTTTSVKANSQKKMKRLRELTDESKVNQCEWEKFWETNESVPSSCKYNLTICDAPKFIWFRNAKVGTRSIFQAFDDANVQLIAESPSNCYYSPDIYNDYFKFAFVRNPWDRFVSGWLGKVVKNNMFNFAPSTLKEMQQFENFVSYYAGFDLDTCDRHFRRQSKLIDINEIDFIGRMESFNEDLQEVFQILELPDIPIPVKNKSSRTSSYHTYYTDDTKNIVSDMYRKDIQLFGYTYSTNE